MIGSHFKRFLQLTAALILGGVAVFTHFASVWVFLGIILCDQVRTPFGFWKNNVVLLAVFLSSTALLFILHYYSRLLIDHHLPSVVNSFMYGFIGLWIARTILWPQTINTEIQSNMIEYLRRVNKLLQLLFKVYIQKEEIKDEIQFITQLQRAKKHCLDSLIHLQRLLKTDRLNLLEHLFEVAQALEGLAYTIQDYATFELAQSEFSDIAQAIDKEISVLIILISQNSVKTVELTVTLDDCIMQLENINKSVLQVVTPEPISFLFFIQNLRVLNEIIVQLSNSKVVA